MAGKRVAVTRSRTADVSDYLARLIETGLEPVDLFEPGVSLEGYAGLVITGGRDVDPSRYGEPRAPQTQEPNPERDELDFTLLAEALQRGLPVLAICRGQQVLNVFLGGSLLQHIGSGLHAAHAEPPNESRHHEVNVEPDTRLARAIGAGARRVNSRHHQAVTPERLATGLVRAAMSPDGYVEAVESPTHGWVVGVQWHPERLEPNLPGFAEASARLFAEFARAVTGS